MQQTASLRGSCAERVVAEMAVAPAATEILRMGEHGGGAVGEAGEGGSSRSQMTRQATAAMTTAPATRWPARAMRPRMNPVSAAVSTAATSI